MRLIELEPKHIGKIHEWGLDESIREISRRSLSFFKKNGFKETGDYEFEEFLGKKRKLIVLKVDV